MEKILLIQTTTETEEAARRIADLLVQSRLAACVQIDGPITSVYRWQGAIETGQEWRCSIKTTAQLSEQVERSITEVHDYDVPEIVAVEMSDVSQPYRDWLQSQVVAESGNGDDS